MSTATLRKRKTGYLTLAGLLLLFGAVIAAYFAQAPQAGAQIGKPAPDFAVPGSPGAPWRFPTIADGP